MLTPPVLDELSEDEMTAPAARGGRVTRRFLAVAVLCGKGCVPGRRDC